MAALLTKHTTRTTAFVWKEIKIIRIICSRNTYKKYMHKKILYKN